MRRLAAQHDTLRYLFLSVRVLSLCLFFPQLYVLSFVSFNRRYLSTCWHQSTMHWSQKIPPHMMQNLWSLVFKEALFSISHWKIKCLVMAIYLKIPAVIYQIFNMKFQETQWILSRLWTLGQTEANLSGQTSIPCHSSLCVLGDLLFPTHYRETEQFWVKKNNLCPFL